VPAENVAMGGSTLLDRIFQGTGNMFLPYDFGEFLRTILARQDLVAHGDLIIRDTGERRAAGKAPERITSGDEILAR